MLMRISAYTSFAGLMQAPCRHNLLKAADVRFIGLHGGVGVGELLVYMLPR